MTYFQNITSLSELKKQYRELVKNNHPDKGGDTAVMQAINNEFEKLYNIWKNRKETADTTGYANDYEGATAKEYTQHIYEEYGWTGSRYDGNLSLSDICKKVAAWAKKTYPNLTFSIYQEHSLSIHIMLMVSDFDPFTEGNFSYNMDLNPYHFEHDERINARAKDILSNIKSYAMSYNYDKSNSMIDYFNTNFYFYIGIGTSKRPFKIEIPKSLRASGACAPEFEYKEGPAHQAIKKALKKQYFTDVKGEMILCEKHFYNDKEYDSECYLFTNSNHFAVKRLEALEKAGIICELTRRGTIKFIGYTPEMEKALADEDRAREKAYKAWQEEQRTGKKHENTKEQPEQEQSQTAEKIGSFKIVDYSERAFAVIGDTRAVENILIQHGGRLNRALTVDGVKCVGWIFSKKRLPAVRLALIGYTVQNIEVNQEQPAEQPVQTEHTEKQPAAEHNQQQPEQAEPVNNSAAYAVTQKSLIFFKSLGVLLDALQELLTEQPKAEEKQPTPEDFAKVLEVIPALLDSVCEIMKAGTHTETHTETETHQPHQEERTLGSNAIYNAVCSSAILTGEYSAARREIKKAIKRYRFTLPQLKYMVYILETHPGINRERLKGAA